MTIRGVGGGNPLPVASTVEELIALEAIEGNESQAHAATQARQTQRATLAAAQQAQVRELRQAANLEMWAGILKGIDTMGSAVATFGVNAAGGSNTRGGQNVEAGMKLGSATNQLVGVYLGSEVAEARARATEHEHAQGSARTAMDQAHEDLEGANRATDRNLDALKQVLAERRRAEEAATRA